MLSKTALSVVKALVYLADQPEGAYVGAGEIAKNIGAPKFAGGEARISVSLSRDSSETDSIKHLFGSRHRIGQRLRAFHPKWTRNGRELDRTDQMHTPAKPQRIGNVCFGLPLISLCPWMNLLSCCSARRELLGGLVLSLTLLPWRSQCR